LNIILNKRILGIGGGREGVVGGDGARRRDCNIK